MGQAPCTCIRHRLARGDEYAAARREDYLWTCIKQVNKEKHSNRMTRRILERISEGETDLVFEYVEAGHPARSEDSGSVSLIQWCAYYGDVSAIKFLLRHGESLESLGEFRVLAKHRFIGLHPWVANNPLRTRVSKLRGLCSTEVTRLPNSYSPLRLPVSRIERY